MKVSRGMRYGLGCGLVALLGVAGLMWFAKQLPGPATSLSEQQAGARTPSLAGREERRKQIRENTLASARKALQEHDYDGAKDILDRVPWLLGDSERIALREKILSEKERTRPKREAAARKASLATQEQNRREYARLLRQKYLDKNLNVKVSVSGSRADRITLQYALFDEVWMHNFLKGDVIESMELMGFKRVILTDGYNYGEHVDLHPPAGYDKR